MLYALIILAILIVLVGLLRLRVRLEFSSERRLLFVGLGRSGPEYDFSRREGVFRLFGRPTKKFITVARPRKAKRPAKPDAEVAAKIEKAKEKPKRRRPLGEILTVARSSAGAVGRYLLALLKTTIIEEAEGEIEAGFASPDITGQVFGYYQAALGISPGLVGRIGYQPVWTGRAFSGSVRLAVAWPLYKLVGQTLLLAARLPLRKIIKLAIGTKEGVQDGK